ncbi:MAG: TraM recognition domain-containing protein [Pyrinomonadaceae bacterium]
MPEQDYWKLITGKSFKSSTWIPSFDDVLEEQWLGLHSKYRLRTLGYFEGGAVRITEEQRPHIHIIGSTQEGKSKFIEYLIRGDIKRGIGCCLIDPTTGGKTVYDVLKYCAYKKIKKVCLIDPYHRKEYNTVAGITPFLYTSEGFKSDYLKETSVKDFQDTTHVLFNVKEESSQMRIERYLPSVLNILYDAKAPLCDVQYFTNRIFKHQREKLLETADNASKLDIEEVFNSFSAFSAFQSTINRMMRFFKGTIGLMFSPEKTVDFRKMVSEGWVILVNLDSGLGFDNLDSRLLGTFIINQITTSIERLNKKGFYKPFYLYIDEASRYANRKLADTLSLKQKTGLKVTLAHQYAEQFEDKYVFDSILANCKITAMFNVKMTKDRDLISKQFYGGDINPLDASYNNSDLPTQHAIIKPLKGKPVRVMIPTVKDAPVSKDELNDYVKALYLRDAWYHNAKELKETNDRTIPTNTKSPQSRKVDDPETDSQTAIPRPIQRKLEKGIRPDNKKPPEPPKKRPIKI